MMHNGRFLPTYREKEVNLITRSALQGQSLSLVGIAGTGKSNLVRYVQDQANLLPYLNGSDRVIRFPVVDFLGWDGTAPGLWQMMLDGLLETVDDGQEAGQKVPNVQAESASALYAALKKVLSHVIFDLGIQIMFVLDESDTFLRQAPTPLIEQLYTLRNSGFRDRLSYLFFTKKLPSVLLRRNAPDYRFKLFDLFSNHIHPLGMYAPSDAHQMLTYLEFREGRRLDRRDFESIQVLAGGHSRLIFVLFQIWTQTEVPLKNPIDFLKKHPDVQLECNRILSGLHKKEQEALLATAKRIQSLEHMDALNLLVARGLLLGLYPIRWFSPLVPATLDQ